MRNFTKSNKKKSSPKTSGCYATPEEAAQAKTAELIAHVKKIGLKVIKTDSSSK